MADKYCFPGLGTGNNDGTTTANAWKTLDDMSAAIGGSVAAGDEIFINTSNGVVARTTSVVFATWEGTGVTATVIVSPVGADWTTPTTLQVNGAGSGATVDGFVLNGRDYIDFHRLELYNWGRHGFTGVTTNNTNIRIFDSIFRNNGGVGLHCRFVSPGTIGANCVVVNCRANNNGSHGFATPVVQNNFVMRCLAYNNAGSGFSFTSSEEVDYHDCISYNNGASGFVLGTTGYSHVSGLVSDGNVNGITFGGPTTLYNDHILVRCRITNNSGTGIITPNSDFTTLRMCAFYGNGTRSTVGVGSLLEEINCTDMASDGYRNRAGGDFRLAAGAEARWVNYPIGGVADTIGLTSGITDIPDFPTVANTFSVDTVDNVAGTGTAPAAGKVMSDAGNFGPGAATAPTLDVGDVRDTVSGGTLSSDNILASNATGSGAGNWNDSEISSDNVGAGVNFGLSDVGTLDGETHTADQVLASAGGNWNDMEIGLEDVRTGKNFGLGDIGLMIEEAHSPDQVIEAGVGGAYHEATPAEVEAGVMFGPYSTYTGEFAGASGSITGITPAGAKIDSQAQVIISGSGFGVLQGAGTITFGSYAPTVDAWSATEITVTLPLVVAVGSVAITVTPDGGDPIVLDDGFYFAADTPGDGTVMGALQDIYATQQLIESRQTGKRKYVKDGASWYLIIYDVDDTTEISRQKLEKYGGGEVTDAVITDSTFPAIVNRDSINPALPAPDFSGDTVMDAIEVVDAKVTKSKKLEYNKQEFTYDSALDKWYLVTYDDDGITVIVKQEVEKYGGGPIGDLTGSAEPSIRNKSSIS